MAKITGKTTALTDKVIDPIATVAGVTVYKQAKGTKTGALDEPVGGQVVAFDAATATLANVSGSASSVTLIASDATRLGAVIVNDSTAICYVKCGSSASATSYTWLLQPGDILEVPYGYTGILTGLWSSATGAARCTAFTA